MHRAVSCLVATPHAGTSPHRTARDRAWRFRVAGALAFAAGAHGLSQVAARYEDETRSLSELLAVNVVLVCLGAVLMLARRRRLRFAAARMLIAVAVLLVLVHLGAGDRLGFRPDARVSVRAALAGLAAVAAGTGLLDRTARPKGARVAACAAVALAVGALNLEAARPFLDVAPRGDAEATARHVVAAGVSVLAEPVLILLCALSTRTAPIVLFVVTLLARVEPRRSGTDPLFVDLGVWAWATRIPWWVVPSVSLTVAVFSAGGWRWIRSTPTIAREIVASEGELLGWPRPRRGPDAAGGTSTTADPASGGSGDA